jgi:hypothetical protein
MSSSFDGKKSLIPSDQIAMAYGKSNYLNLIGDKRLIQKLRWLAFSGYDGFAIRKDIADKFIEAEVPGARSLPVGEPSCGSEETCCSSRFSNSVYCLVDDRKKLILEFIQNKSQESLGFSLEEIILHFCGKKSLPCVLKDEASLRYEISVLVANGYLISHKDHLSKVRYAVNTTPQPIRRGPGRPLGS